MYNVLLLTVDDLNYDTIGCFGSPVENVSPNIDTLCAEGIKFTNSNVTIAVCQPSRSSLLTGLYPHRNGARGFEAIDASCTTFPEVLHNHGYLNGIIGKEDHVAPRKKFFWDFYQRTINDENDFGRNPEKYYQYTNEFVSRAKAEGKPFFLMANSHDPHRPFAGAAQEIKKFGRHIACDFMYSPDDVNIKACHPDLPEIREEMAQYYSSVHRGDKTVGRVLDVLKEQGVYDDTLILFLSDNGMALPFCKTNCYLNGTRSPYIMKLPKDLQNGAVKETDVLINGIDVTPTFLDLIGLPPIEGIDGKSFKKAIYGGPDYQDDIFTLFFKTSIQPKTGEPGYYPMRAVQNKKYLYIYNGWSDGEARFQNESMAGLTFDAMQKAAETDEKIRERVELFLYRKKEEFFDISTDPECLNDLIDDGRYANEVAHYRRRMLSYMEQSRDAYLNRFKEEVVSKM